MNTSTFLTINVMVVIATIALAHILRPINDGKYYPWVALLIILLMAVLPVFHNEWPLLKRILIYLVMPIIGMAVWVLGFVIAGYPIINKLF